MQPSVNVRKMPSGVNSQFDVASSDERHTFMGLNDSKDRLGSNKDVS